MTTKDLTGQEIDQYYLEGVLGRGTAGIVYRVLTIDGEPVALKLFAPLVGDEDELLLNRFELEAKIISRLDHPNIVPLLDVGKVGERPYMVMPLIKGESLDELLKRKIA